MYARSALMDDVRRFKYAGMETGCIGKTVSGANIPYIFLGNKRGGCAVVQAAIHAREHITSALTVRLIDYTLSNCGGLLKRAGIYFIPMVNIDGVELSKLQIANHKLQMEDNAQSAQKQQLLTPNSSFLTKNNTSQFSLFNSQFFTKDRIRFLTEINGGGFYLWKANANAVDLNCNFPARWGTGAENVKHPAPGSWPGPWPASEPETRALMDFTRAVKPSVTLSYHCKGREIYWQFRQHEPELSRDRELALKAAAVTGYTLIDGDRDSAGGYKDWCVESLKIPALTVEIVSDDYSHPVPYSVLEEEFELNKRVPEILLDYCLR